MTSLHRRVADLFFPLSDFYSSHNEKLPRIVQIPGESVPPPYRSLLVHEQDMTSTLESYWGTSLHLKILDKQIENASLTRQVLLLTDTDEQPVEFGAIRIQLNRFEDSAREEILACHRPLGNLLLHFKMSFSCLPSAFFSFESDETIQHAFALTEPHTLYGRHTILVNDVEETLAEVVEILPPLQNPTLPE